MQAKSRTVTQARRRRKIILWLAGAAAIVTLLLYFEQVALLYVGATLGLVIFLIMVGWADLEGKDAEINARLNKEDTGVGSVPTPAVQLTQEPGKQGKGRERTKPRG